MVESKEGVTVVITKDRITGVGKVGFVPEGRNIHVINANGKYLIPGLWDMHVHSAFVSPAWDEKVIYPLYIANGVTVVRDMGGDPDVLDKRRTRIESGELLGPAHDSGGPVSGGGKERPADDCGEYARGGAPRSGHGQGAGAKTSSRYFPISRGIHTSRLQTRRRKRKFPLSATCLIP